MTQSSDDIWKKYNYCKDRKCPQCKLDFIWYEYVKVIDEDNGSLKNCSCPGNKEDVTKCPHFIVYKRDTDIGIILDDI